MNPLTPYLESRGFLFGPGNESIWNAWSDDWGSGTAFESKSKMDQQVSYAGQPDQVRNFYTIWFGLSLSGSCVNLFASAILDSTSWAPASFPTAPFRILTGRIS
jgi:hypothetical protein